MTRYAFRVEVECDNLEQATTVMGYRLGHDEEIEPDDGGPFDYQINWWLGVAPKSSGAELLYSIRRRDLDDLSPRPVTDDEADRFREAFPNTSVMECITGCLDSIVEP